ncbi:MAG: valine--tRNA ligase [Planctomycetes bacterium]|nr:valine--tRNA ligase [Planctomycetota bacterium]
MNTPDLPKQYEPQKAQARWYPHWESQGYFHAEPDPERAAYAIVIPPPNVTGALHLGHALNNTIQDLLIRWRRMQGRDTLWMPGTDHAGIATQAVVERRLFEQEKLSRHDIGREGLVARIWKWKDEYEARILGQLRRMGCSCDWQRTRFTLDDVCARAVRHTFFRLFRKGLIYRGKRLVNWDTFLQTAVADDEIFYEEVQSSLWYFRYPLTDRSGHVVIATTRPETMLGDTAVAVHPDDPRYRDLVGKTVTLPLVHREIPILADAKLVDPKFGTGCVKVTPAHDPNDYATGLRHGLAMINILTPDGHINDNGGAFAGQDRYEARQNVVRQLESLGLLEKTEPYPTKVGHSDRSKTPIEPYLSDQWFVQMADLAESAMQAVRDGRVRFHPERYARSYLDWLGEKRDWCISRQLWWGHRIPIWYAENVEESDLQAAFRGRDDVCWTRLDASGRWLICSLTDLTPDALGHGHALTQDPDVLDTWFSSALWPHSTLGWPEATPELERYYPTSVLVTSRDIISLWVARMVITGLENLGQVPFHDVYIHAKILDGQGRAMSKSAGNGVDPLDIIEKYGADALRFTLASLCTDNQDARLPVKPEALPDGRRINTSERFELGRNFANKLWNASRFVLLNLEGVAQQSSKLLPGAEFRFEDRWMLSRLTRTTEKVTAHLEAFTINEVANTLYDFVWHEFCDWYLEMVKPRLRPEADADARLFTQRCLAYVLDHVLRLLHPILPFVTEEIWQYFGQILPHRGLPSARQDRASASVMIAAWPIPNRDLLDPASESEMVRFQLMVRGVRNIRRKLNLPERQKLDVRVKVPDAIVAAALQHHRPLLQKLALVEDVQIAPDLAKPENAASEVVEDVEVYVPLAHIDREAEKKRLEDKQASLRHQIEEIRKKLGNEHFVQRAPAAVVERERTRLGELRDQYERLSRNLVDLKA